MWESTDIIGFGIQATDGSIGSIDDLLVDDQNWSVRWVVVDTGTWLPGRKVLLPPSCFGASSMSDRQFPVQLTRQELKDSPDIGTDAPVSRQMESDIYGYYGWNPYWGTGYLPPVRAAGMPEATRAEAMNEPSGDSHLRSAEEITGYEVSGTDDEIGTVDRLLVDQEGWIVRYMVLDTGTWLPGKKVLVSPQWIRDISWPDGAVTVDLMRVQVKEGPEYNPAKPIDMAYEDRLFRHYGHSPTGLEADLSLP